MDQHLTRVSLIEGSAASVQEVERANNIAWESIKVDEMTFALPQGTLIRGYYLMQYAHRILSAPDLWNKRRLILWKPSHPRRVAAMSIDVVLRPKNANNRHRNWCLLVCQPNHIGLSATFTSDIHFRQGQLYASVWAGLQRQEFHRTSDTCIAPEFVKASRFNVRTSD